MKVYLSLKIPLGSCNVHNFSSCLFDNIHINFFFYIDNFVCFINYRCSFSGEGTYGTPETSAPPPKKNYNMLIVPPPPKKNFHTEVCNM